MTLLRGEVLSVSGGAVIPTACQVIPTEGRNLPIITMTTNEFHYNWGNSTFWQIAIPMHVECRKLKRL